MSYKLFLDDIRLPYWIYDDYPEWIVVRNQEDLISKIKTIGVPEIISFDNDLGMDDSGNILPDGYSCLNWLIENNVYVKGVIVHSDNVIANEQIFGKVGNWHNYLISENILDKKEVFNIKRPAMKNLTDNYKKSRII